MIERVRLFVNAFHLNAPDIRILVAVSGGIDSMTLLDILRKVECQCAVAHMNYGLRGNDSDEDELLVKNFCNDHGIVFHTKKVNLDTSIGLSTQMAARGARYEWFAELLDQEGYDFIATAHHLNDSFETTILNLSKGTGISGLTGIPVVNGHIVRPFSEITQSEIRIYAMKHGVLWREDRSNAELKYQRNKIRNSVISVLEELNPSLIDTFQMTLERLKGVEDLLQREVEQIRIKYLACTNPDVLSMEWYSSSRLNDVLLSEILKAYGVSYVLSKEIAQAQLSGSLFLTNTHQINIDRGKLLISELGSDPIPCIAIDKVGSYKWGPWQIELRTAIEWNLKANGNGVALVDASKFSFPMTIRSWQDGDTFVPLGMKGKKKLSDFMIDIKIALTMKQTIPIFVCGESIVWVGGYRLDDRFKVTGNTKEVITIKLSRID